MLTERRGTRLSDLLIRGDKLGYGTYKLARILFKLCRICNSCIQLANDDKNLVSQSPRAPFVTCLFLSEVTMVLSELLVLLVLFLCKNVHTSVTMFYFEIHKWECAFGYYVNVHVCVGHSLNEQIVFFHSVSKCTTICFHQLCHLIAFLFD